MKYQEMAKLFLAGKTRKLRNVLVCGGTYTLHKSVIAKITEIDGTRGVLFDWCGWYTATTAAHINRILREMDCVGQRVGHARHRDSGISTFFVPFKI